MFNVQIIICQKDEQLCVVVYDFISGNFLQVFFCLKDFVYDMEKYSIFDDYLVFFQVDCEKMLVIIFDNEGCQDFNVSVYEKCVNDGELLVNEVVVCSLFSENFNEVECIDSWYY